MNASDMRSAVIVGVDGSQAALHAAEWAVDEARIRGIPLRLVAVIKATHPSNEDYHRDLKHAETSLRAAHAAVEAMGLPLKVETEIRRGQPAAILVSESPGADMLCIGSWGIGRYSAALLGSTATDVAEQAHCPVAVIRSQPGQPRKDINWVVVTVDDEANDAVVDQAMSEAQLHRLPVLAIGGTQQENAETAPGELDNRLTPWRRWYPDIHVYPVATRADVARFLHDNDHSWTPLAVIGSDDAGQLAQIIGAQHPIFRHTETSVLVVPE